MGRLTDRMPVAEQSAEDPARVPRPAGPEQSPEESPEDALTRLQSTVGNEGMASVVGGVPAAKPDGGAPDGGPVPEADAGPAPAPVADGGPRGVAAAEEASPGIGQVVGGVFAAKAIAAGALGHDADLMGHMGEGSSGYEKVANDIEGVCAILDMASNLVNVLAGVVGIVAVAATAAAFFTLGALAPLAVAAGEIALAFGAAGAVLGGVKMALQPLVVLFRSLHTFTSAADPRAIEAQGKVL